MRTLFLVLMSWVALAGCGSKDAKTPAKQAAPVSQTPAPVKTTRAVRLFVAPFSDDGKNGLDYFSIGLALAANARFEEASYDRAFIKAMADAGFAFEVVTGPQVLPEDSAKLAATRSDDGALADLHAAAKRAGATHVLTGAYGGRVEKWRLEVALYEVGPDGLKEIAKAEDTRKIYAGKKDTPKPERPGIQIGTVHEMLGALIGQVFVSAKLPLPADVVAALSTPATPDIVSFINLSRAYRALLADEEDDETKMDNALGFAQNAVRIWPDYQIARRLYAWLLWQTGSPEKARLHFQEALKCEADKAKKGQCVPDDIRSFVALGRIDLATDQADSARQELEVAAKLRPGDANVQYWLGAAFAKLGQIGQAVKGYELSRSLDPNNLETRRALASLYAGQKRYAEAVVELKVVVDRDPKDPTAVYLLAACARAAGDMPAALAAYDLGAKRFPDDQKFRALRKDAVDGVGAELAGRIAQAGDLRKTLENLRAEFQDAVNDGTWQLLNRKKEDACADGNAGSDELLAKAKGKAYENGGLAFQERIALIRAALKDGKGLALTPDENASAEDLLLYEQSALRDDREMRTAFEGTFKPQLERLCGAIDPDKIAVAKIEDVRARNGQRVVSMPEPPKRDASGISPVVPPDVVDNKTWYVENDTKQEIILILDGKPLEPSVPPRHEGGKPMPFSAQVGNHELCHVPKGVDPKCLGFNVRTVQIDEGLIYHVQ